MRVTGIDCPSCVYSIRRSLAKLDGIFSVDIEPSTGQAVIEYDDARCSLKKIYRAIVEAGYDIEKERLVLELRDVEEEETGLLESRLLEIKGVIDSHISPVTRLMSITFNPLSISRDALLEKIRGMGLRVAEAGEVEITRSEMRVDLRLTRRIVAFTIGLFAVIYAMARMNIESPHGHDATILLAILSMTTTILGLDIVIKGIRSLLRLSPTMSSLIALSTLTSLVAGYLSHIGLLGLENIVHTESFFEASAGVMGFVSLGFYLEERLRSRAFKSLEKLAQTLYGHAKVVEEDGVKLKDVRIIRPGEIVEVKAGEIIPVDGVVIEGWGYVDESSFTGEPTPRLKKADTRDPVLAGSILTTGYIKVRVTRATRDTVLYNIIETVREAQFYKPRIVRIADRIVGLLAWLVLGVSLTTLLYWWIIADKPSLALIFAASVLVIACPCALGIAVPMVVSIAILKSARRGIMIRRGDVFERLNEATVVFFDKTGTLTIGMPSIRGLCLIDEEINEEKILHHVCSVESRSEHQISRAFASYCRERNVNLDEPSDYVHLPGMGVIGYVNGVRVAVGNKELIQRLDIVTPEKLERLIDDIASRGHTPVIVAIDNRVVGVFEIGDTLRTEAREVIRILREMGIKTGILSGDSSKSVEYYSRLLGLDMYYSELKPEDKAEIIRSYQQKGERVVFVGDGVNDAPAISVSHVGVAMGSGSEISRESGDVVLARSRLEDLVVLYKLSRLVRRKSIENIAWSFIYNAALIPIAAGILYGSHGVIVKPEFAALAMVLSDITVVLNASTILARAE